ncbi:hypothetical protein K505DRAFT_361360 [Melanomma pulvis-pyrius CBS 109.77]|uniref:JmjC domain-containing protein n=1 Tax=Melanomma pulvis-pyrius CBS 109.77 TaxID=1314802 RepID=A0A6A6XCD2_9PLEO|nr:hypothetical protein K505DRAFT_361360 [Melanomma pulvis-pyrius CBS 109.77]
MPSPLLNTTSCQSLNEIIQKIPKDPFWLPLIEVLTYGSLLAIDPRGPLPTYLHQLFGPDPLDVPHFLSHTAFSPTLTGRHATSLIVADILSSTRRSRITAHPSRSKEEDEISAAQLLLSTSKPLYRGTGQGVWNFISPRLDKLYAIPEFVTDLSNRQEVLEIGPASVNIMPCAAIADLHHDVGYGVATLVQGAKLWILYPPTPANLDALCLSYSQTSATHQAAIFANFRRLKNGIVFVQPQNTTLLVPPFCAHAVFTLQTSVLVGREVYSKRKFVQRLENERVQVAWTRAEQNTERRERDVREQMRHLKVVLKTEDMGEREKMLRAWDVVVQNGALESLAEGMKCKLEEWKKIWVTATRGWIECPVCKVKCEEGNDEKGQRRVLRSKKMEVGFGEHFGIVHWRNAKR